MIEGRLSSSPYHIVLDWDGTLTKSDTLHFLTEICSIGRRRRRGSGDRTEDNETIQQRWNDIVERYTEDYRAHENSYQPSKTNRTTIEQEATWLASLAPVEDRSIRRVQASEIFKGVKADDIRTVAEQLVESGRLELREGWQTLFHLGAINSEHGPDRSRDEGVSISILSVNWSERFIRECLLCATRKLARIEGKDEGRGFLERRIREVAIYANEIEGIDTADGSEGILTKNSEGGIRTSGDKLNVFERLMSRSDRTESGTELDRRQTVFYVGDSNTDIECLLAADYGICIRDELMMSAQQGLDEILARIGVSVRDIGEFETAEKNPKTLWESASISQMVQAIRRTCAVQII